MKTEISTPRKPFSLRMPPDIEAIAKAQAKQFGRSLNAEIVYRLKQAYAADGIKLEAA